MAGPSETTTIDAPFRGRRSRIPLSLQAVFLASNRGKDVHKPPPEKAGNKTFFGNWFFQRKADSKRKIKLMDMKNTKKNENCCLEKTSAGVMDRKNQRNQKNQPYNKNRQCNSVATDGERQSPHAYLDNMLRSRGYSTQRFKTLCTSYYNKPTPLQEASYDAYLIGLIRRKDVEEFSHVMSCGLSPNACNRFGESVLHTVCRHGNNEMLETLIQNGATLQVSDDYGRTPLHDACWAAKPAFETVKLILQHDVRQFHMMDTRGHVPLNYVREEHWADWIEFLETNADLYWPKASSSSASSSSPPQSMILENVNTKRIPDPVNSLSCELAKMVACGRMSPEEASFLNSGDATDPLFSDDEDDEDDASFLDSEDDTVCTDDDDDDDDDDDGSCYSFEEVDDFDEDEMELLLAGLTSRLRGQ